jgi:hypothetical protein
VKLGSRGNFRGNFLVLDDRFHQSFLCHRHHKPQPQRQL